MSELKYAVLMETNGEEHESWYYFLKFNGNESKLKYLSKQIEQIEMYIIDEMSTFDLDLENLVSEQTAKEMTKVELNSVTFHRKFDGQLQHVNLMKNEFGELLKFLDLEVLISLLMMKILMKKTK